MSEFFTAKDTLSANLPGLRSRSIKVKAQDSRASAAVLVPEYEFNRRFVNVARRLARSGKNVDQRNKIVRGVQTREETYATLEIVGLDEQNSESDATFEEFILQNVQEATQEKYQLVETFGETVGFFFGTRPKVYQYSGTLMNTQDYPWRDNWKDFYETKLRGTRLVEKQCRAYLTYNWVLREGYILSMNINEISAKPNQVDFSFVFFITKEVNLDPQSIEERAREREFEENRKQFEDSLDDRLKTTIDTSKDNVDNLVENGFNRLRVPRSEGFGAQGGAPPKNWANENPGVQATNTPPRSWIHEGTTSNATQIGHEMVAP